MEFLLDVCLVVEPQGQDVCFLFFVLSAEIWAYSAKIQDMRVSQLRVETLTTSRSASKCIKFHISHLISTLKKPRRFALFVFWDSSGSLNSTHVAFLVTEDGGCYW